MKPNILNVHILTIGKSFFLLIALPLYLFAQDGRIINEKVLGKSLENTVTKENPERDVAIYLPPNYDRSPDKRYPVIYLLHGVGDTEQTWIVSDNDQTDDYATIRDVMNNGIATGKFGEMIIVMPNEKTNWFGSFYVNSSVTGNWEDFTVKELVGYIDKNYRTIANEKNRGIAGHSMGGYGAIVLSMKHPDIFSIAYGMNPAAVDWAGDIGIATPGFRKVLEARTFEDLFENLSKGEIYSALSVSVGRAFSPNPNKPPFYCDFAFKIVDGKMQPNEPAFSLWEENFPIKMVKKYRSNLLKLRGLRFDSGYEDSFTFIPPASRALSQELTTNGIEHIFEEYNGDHNNRIWGKRGRIYTEVLPYFWDLFRES